MKIESGRIDAFIKSPHLNLILLHGPDAGLVAERGQALARGVEGALADPFRYAELQNPPADALLAEAYAAALTGGQRVVRVRDAAEIHAKALEKLVKSPPESLVILEAGELTGKSKLRGAAEKAAEVAVLACYVIDQARLPQVVAARLRGAGVRIDQDAAIWAGQNLSGEEGPLAQALEVLTLYAGVGKQLGLADVKAVLADGGDGSMGDAMDAALTGDMEGADRALGLAYEEGITPVAMVRVLLAELLRLRVAAGAMAEGASAQEAVAGMRPPVFFKRQIVVGKMLRLWPPAALDQVLAAMLAAEAACKTTLVPEHDYCRQTVLALAQRARAQARR